MSVSPCDIEDGEADAVLDEDGEVVHVKHRFPEEKRQRSVHIRFPCACVCVRVRVRVRAWFWSHLERRTFSAGHQP